MNKWIGIGRLTTDPTLNHASGSGVAICRFTLAVARQFKKDEADFINCVAFNKTAENIAQYFAKGRQIAVTGNIRTGSYDAKDGTKRYTTDINVETFEFVGNAQGNNQNQSQDNGFGGSFADDMTPVDEGDMPFN